MDVHLDANMDNIVWKIANTAYFPFPYHQWKEGRTRMARIKIKTIPEWLGLQQMSSKSDLSSPRLVALARQADSNCSPIWLLAKRKKGRFMPFVKGISAQGKCTATARTQLVSFSTLNNNYTTSVFTQLQV